MSAAAFPPPSRQAVATKAVAVPSLPPLPERCQFPRPAPPLERQSVCERLPAALPASRSHEGCRCSLIAALPERCQFSRPASPLERQSVCGRRPAAIPASRSHEGCRCSLIATFPERGQFPAPPPERQSVRGRLPAALPASRSHEGCRCSLIAAPPGARAVPCASAGASKCLHCPCRLPKARAASAESALVLGRRRNPPPRPLAAQPMLTRARSRTWLSAPV